jgi:hypothetical protein
LSHTSLKQLAISDIKPKGARISVMEAMQIDILQSLELISDRFLGERLKALNQCAAASERMKPPSSFSTDGELL